jgi:hypothetical protein
MKILIRIKWVEGKNQWHMELPDGTFIQEFYGCDSFLRLFDTPKKKKPLLYTVEVKPYGKKNR